MSVIHPRAAALRIWTARTLVVLGAAILAWVAVDTVRAAAYQREYFRVLHRDMPKVTADVDAPTTVDVGDPIGWLEIPTIGLSAAVVHGDSDDLLKTAIGHLPDTPLPWDTGNSALAAHRDTLFRSLRHIRLNDIVRLKTAHGDLEYRVHQTFVVGPEDVWVLDPTSEETLTLITCYPFNYVGNAPRRFIVRAERLERSQTPRAAAVGGVGGPGNGNDSPRA
jgi:sortase A